MKLKYILAIILFWTIFTNGLSIYAQNNTKKELFELNTAEFVIKFKKKYKDTAKIILDKATASKQIILHELGGTIKSKITIILVDSHEDFEKSLPSKAPVHELSAGIAYPKRSLIVLKLAGVMGVNKELFKVLTHELSHIILYHVVNFISLPRWFVEGFAIYQSEEWSITRFTTISVGILGGRILDIEDLTVRFPNAQYKKEDINLAYAQSIDLVSFIFKKYKKEGIQQLITELKNGSDFLTALKSVTQMSISDFEELWFKDMKTRYSWLPAITGATTIWIAASLIFLMAYYRKRKSAKRRMKEWEYLESENPDTEKQDQETDDINHNYDPYKGNKPTIH